MFLFDLHCDTITELCKKGEDLSGNSCHISIEKLDSAMWCQCFAIFMPDDYRGQDAISFFERNYAYFLAQMKKYAGRVVQVRTYSEISSALASGKIAALLTVESASVLAGDLSRVQRISEAGVRMMTLTWNGKNEVGSGNLTQDGLSEFGRGLIPVMERAGIIVDISHINDRGFWEVAELAHRPFVASHSNARSVHGHLRNLTDAQIRYMVCRGGLIGLNFYHAFISGCPDAGPEMLMRHIAHFLSFGAQDILALGSDFDGADMPVWLNGAADMPKLYSYVADSFGCTIADKIFFENAAAFFERYEKE